MNYGSEHQGKVYGPDGLIQDTEGRPLAAGDTEAYNKAVEAKEIEWLKTGPDRVFAYVRHHGPDAAGGYRWLIGTWMGTVISEGTVSVGPRAYTGFGFRDHTYRRPIRCRIFGVLYHGWYMESSGDYCRLKKAKRQ